MPLACSTILKLRLARTTVATCSINSKSSSVMAEASDLSQKLNSTPDAPISERGIEGAGKDRHDVSQKRLLSLDSGSTSIDQSAFVAPNATIIGNVRIGRESTILFGAVIRGDSEAITIGNQSNVQDLCCLHCDPGFPCRLGNRVTVGHGAIVHGAEIEDDVLIGIRAVVMNGAKIGRDSIIGAGALVPEGKVIPPRSVVLGVPGKIVREATEADMAYIRHAAQHYVEAGKQYLAHAAGRA
jgi:carbonic anhydrase/acetyltransferase-like protein (isoleucine patch superfamily)